MSDLVSIIIPCYNALPLLGPAIDSALNQTYPHIEVIVVDDGSTDKSLELVKSYGARVKWTTGPNKGVAAAFNHGMAMATGKYVQFLGADDLLHPQKTALSMEVFATHPEVDFVWAPIKIFSKDDELTGWDSTKKIAVSEVILVSNALEAAYAPGAAVLKKSILDSVGLFDESLRRWTDLEYHARLAVLSRKHARMNVPLHGYRQHAGPRISDANKKHTNLENGLLALKGTHKALDHPNISVAARQKVLFPFYVLLARTAAAAGDAGVFKDCLEQAAQQTSSVKFKTKARYAIAASRIFGLKFVSFLLEKTLK